MKLQKLTINNIASIEHAVIDFGSSPLADERLFLITGETGSGKSTIIDCLCLALYGGTPRLKGANARSNTSYDSARDEGISIIDPRQLMRRGSVKADVELTFENDGIPYIATWEVHRAHNKIDGKMSNATRTLRTAEGVTPAIDLRKAKDEINPFIERLIGLNMDQFFRTVVLAQGKFSEFLNSSEKEKAELLEKMTGTEIYTLVGKKIYEVYQEKVKRCVSLAEQIEKIVPLSTEQKNHINDELGRCVREQEIVKRQHDKAQKMAKWLDEMDSNEQEIKSNQNLLMSKLNEITAPDFLEGQALVRDWENTAEARQQLKHQQEALTRLTALKNQEPELQHQYDALCAAFRATVADMETKRQLLDNVESTLQQQEPYKEMYGAIGQIKSLMMRLDKNRNDINVITADLKKDLDKRPQAIAEADRQDKNCQELGKDLKHLQNLHKELNVGEANDEKDRLNNAKQGVNDLCVILKSIDQIQDALNNHKDQLKTEQKTLEKALLSIELKRAAETNAKQNLDRQKDWNNLLLQAHQTLKEGDQCPICGNTIGKILVPKSESELEQLNEDHEKALADLQQTEVLIKTVEGRIKDCNKLIVNCEQDLVRSNEELNKQWKITLQALIDCGIHVDGIITREQAQTIVADIESHLTSLNGRLRQADSLNEQISSAQKRYNDAVTTCNKAHNDLITLQESIKRQRQLIDNLNGDADVLTTELNGLFAFKDWQERHRADSCFVAHLQQEAATYQKLVDDKGRLSRSLELAGTAIEAIKKSRAAITDFVDNGITAHEVPDDLEERWRSLETLYLKWKTRLKAEQETIDRATHDLDKHLERYPDISTERLAILSSYQPEQINALKTTQITLDKAITSLKGSVATLERQRAEITARKPDCEEQNPDRLDAIIEETSEKLEGLNNHIVELRVQLTTDEEKLKRIGDEQKTLREAEAERNRWERFSKTLGSADGATLRKIAQSYILGELLTGANAYLRQFNNRYELMAKPASLVILARDLAQGDVTSVNTLSGGESFMVALALALALAGMTGKVFAVDTLFIDEGFGSLSPVYLDNVMEALNRLYDIGGRHVGIISHVETLRERVTTQIRVCRDTGNSTVSRIQVIG